MGTDFFNRRDLVPGMFLHQELLKILSFLKLSVYVNSLSICLGINVLSVKFSFPKSLPKIHCGGESFIYVNINLCSMYLYINLSSLIVSSV